MKTIIVTGAAGNLGQAVVSKFLAEGYRVIGTVAPGHGAKPVISHANFETSIVDLEDELATETFVTNTIREFTNIHGVVATVGGFEMGSILKTTTGDIARQYKLNFETAYNIARPAFRHMLENGTGRIFLVGSRPGLHATDSKGMVAYGLAKSMLFRLAELMNGEAGQSDVVTSVIVPGTIDTAPNRSSMPDADFDKWVTPGAIADIVYFYCTPEAAALREPVIKVYNKA